MTYRTGLDRIETFINNNSLWIAAVCIAAAVGCALAAGAV